MWSKKELVTRVEDDEIIGYYNDECDIWYVTSKKNNATTKFYGSSELFDKSEDYILEFLHKFLTKKGY